MLDENRVLRTITPSSAESASKKDCMTFRSEQSFCPRSSWRSEVVLVALYDRLELVRSEVGVGELERVEVVAERE